MNHTFSRVTLIALAVAFIHCGVRAQEGSTGPQAEISNITRVWSDAIVAKDLVRIAALSLPESREYISARMGDPTTKLYQFLFGEENSIRSLLQSDRAEVWNFAHEDLKTLGGGTTVCVVSARVAAQGRPTTLEAIVQHQKHGLVRCVFFFHSDRQWYVNYDWVEDPDN